MATPQSFGRVITARARRDPDEIVLTSEHEQIRLSANEIDTFTNRLARAYMARGVTRHSLVTVLLPTGVEFVLSTLAIWKAGATPHPVSPDLPQAARAELESMARPSLVVGGRATTAGTPWLPPGFIPEASSAPVPDDWARCWKATTTSGSTSSPKIVLAAAPATIDPSRPVADFLPRRAVQLVTTPIWHSAQFTYAFRGLLTGHRLVLTGGFDERTFTEHIATHRITWTMLSPSHIHRLVRHGPRGDISTLERLLHLGAACSPEDKRALIGWMGADRIVEVYAGSESNGLTMITGSQWLAKPGSVGKPIGGTRLQIRRVDNSPADTGEIGQVWMRRGDTASYRYLGRPTRRTGDGWDTLGDLGYLDDDGYLFLADRASDVIDREGVPVYPSRVEHALQRHPAVRDAVVFADCDGLVSAIVDIADNDVGDDALLTFVGPHLQAYEMPSTITLTRSPLRNAAGKVRRSAFCRPHPTATPV